MRRPLTLGVLSTSFGGAYFGELMASIAARQAAVGGRLVAIQTLDAGTYKRDVAKPPPFPHHVAWDHLSAVVVILNAVSGDYLQRLHDSGRPVVVISDTPVGFECPIVVPDNVGGARAATEHLIQHGHRRIAFAGLIEQPDVRERYDVFRQTLLDHGLTPDLFFDTGDMQISGGRYAARAMLEAGLPSTAVVTGNDDNAMGIVEHLQAAGLELPRDQAIIGFDDTEDNIRLTPRLTSVRLPLEDIGDLAVSMVTRMADGEHVPDGPHRVPTTLTIRESCGCSDAQSLPVDPVQTAIPIEDESGLLTRMSVVLGARLPVDLRNRHQGDVAEVVGSVTRAVRAAIGEPVELVEPGGEPADDPHLRGAVRPLGRLVNSKEHLVGAMRAAREYARALTGPDLDDAARARVEKCLDRFLVMLAQAWSAKQAERLRSTTNTLKTQYSVSMELLRGQERDPRSLDWLRLTDIRNGCLGLWPDHRSTGQRSSLSVVAAFDHERGALAGAAGDIALESFPPDDIVARADPRAGDMVFVAHLKVGAGDWGMLALVGPVQTGAHTGRESMNQLAALLSVALEHESVLSTMREQEEHLRRAALYDELTGLPNRAYFRDRLRLAMTRVDRRGHYQYAVLMLDLDGFKLVNDSLGHVTGDRLLQQVAERISGRLRAVDTAARFGGDEFAILLEDIDGPEAATVLAERLLIALSTPYRLNDTDVVISASIGIALGSAGYEDTEAIVRDADVAMYHAKSRGKRAHALFHPSMHATAVSRLRIEGELRRALENDELELYYQPIVDLSDDTVSGAEALIRWQHPVRGLLTPADFLPVAEESGLVLGVGDWVLEQACHQMKDWGYGQPGACGFMISVNVANREFWRPRLIEDVEKRLADWGLEPARLAIEITEGVIMHDVGLASSILARLSAMGVQVHIDDFGTGYSSLEALQDLSIDALKVDRSFVSRSTTSARSRELVRTIVQMGLNLDLDVIAEGIETPEEADLVRELGCTHGQGDLYSTPVPGGEFSTGR